MNKNHLQIRKREESSKMASGYPFDENAFRCSNTAFANGLNIPGKFTGTIINRENIGKATTELSTNWNADNPDDQVSFSAS